MVSDADIHTDRDDTRAGVQSSTITQRIAADIRRGITSGDYAPGEGLPSEQKLTEKYQASRGTVRRALGVLVAEGLIRGRSGLGYFVRQYAPIDFHVDTFEHSRHRRDVDPGADAWEAEVKSTGRTPDQQVDVSIIVPPAGVAEALNTPDGEMVVIRRRLRTVDDEPYMTADSHYPIDVAEGSPIMAAGNLRVPGGLMAAAGHKQVRYLDTITARPPSREEALRLDLQPGTAVAEYRRTGFNAAGRPVRHIITIAPGDRVRIVYEVSAE